MNSLQPVVHPLVNDFLEQRRAIEWLTSFGSPLNIVFPQIAAASAKEWQQTLRQVYRKVDIRFALKCCKSSALLNTFAFHSIGADCSSSNETLKAIENAVAPSRISLTGAHKTDREYRMAIALGVAIHVDAPDTGVRLIELSRDLGIPPNVVLRFRPTGQTESRFGMNKDDVLQTARELAAWGCELNGVAFHLNGYGIQERIDASIESLQIIALLHAEGLPCRSLDIGGGFPVNYLLDRDFEENLPAMPRWRDRAMPVTYPYHNDLAGSAAAEAILKGIFADEGASEIIHALDLHVILQPGRALVDQSGVSAFSVVGRKRTAVDLSVLALDGMNFSMSERWFGSDFLPSPLLLTPDGYYESLHSEYILAGNSCLEDDLIRQLPVGYAVSPTTGNAVVFVNTAGYQMDSNESEFHQRRLPRKVAAVSHGGRWTAILDEEFIWRSQE
ncbi:hypothetical protein [Rhizobium leguminosarum]|uniref:hypothetical protein n=1 Tax=Rhizobium leguminosarum TaxID=384 RepID=UPI001C9449AB|nr:hypothetical protein [Rhizobium leguminosarum]MBY5371451.1 hypothetical protein [Rhizobium leguminosarum]